MAESPKLLHLIEIRVGEHDGIVRILIESRNLTVSRMRNEKYAIWPIRLAESPKFLHLIGNRVGEHEVTSDF